MTTARKNLAFILMVLGAVADVMALVTIDTAWSLVWLGVALVLVVLGTWAARPWFRS